MERWSCQNLRCPNLAFWVRLRLRVVRLRFLRFAFRPFCVLRVLRSGSGVFGNASRISRVLAALRSILRSCVLTAPAFYGTQRSITSKLDTQKRVHLCR